MDINSIASEFIEINQRRREFEKREEYLKGILVEHFQSTKTLSLDTDKGRICYQASQRTDYDIPLLRQSIPETVFQLVTKLSVNDALLSQLVKDGKVDSTKIEKARRISSVYRIVVQSLPDRPSMTPVQESGSIETSLDKPGKTGEAQDKLGSQREKSRKRPSVSGQEAQEKPKRSRKPKGAKPSS